MICLYNGWYLTKSIKKSETDNLVSFCFGFFLILFLFFLNLPIADSALGGGYFYDLAPHQIDLLQDLFGVITRAHGYPANRAHLYEAEDTISACFFFESGL